MLRLCIQDWDEQRGFTRTSRYAGFKTDEKIEFLSALAYSMNRDAKLSFTDSYLEKFYRSVASRFELPENQASEVADEIESHSGLIVRVRGWLSVRSFLVAGISLRPPHRAGIVE